MIEVAATLDPRIALLVHAALAAATVGLVLAVAFVLRERGGPGAGYGIYESGAPDVEPATATVPTSYFLVAAAFVIFDVEAAILFAWAVSAAEAGWSGLVAAGVFIAILLAALAYLSADGALDIGPRPRNRAAAPGGQP